MRCVTLSPILLHWSTSQIPIYLKGWSKESRSDERYSNIARVRADRNWGVPKIRALFEATYFTGLRKAGMPEE
jgi:hypothetical protein